MPERWRILVERRRRKILRQLPKDVLERIRQAVRKLADNPRAPGCTKLSGYDDLWRIRVGDWRITYAIEDDQLIILIVEVSPRGRAYSRL